MTGWLRRSSLAPQASSRGIGEATDGIEARAAVDRIDAAATTDAAWSKARLELERLDPSGSWALGLLEIRSEFEQVRAEIDRQLATAVRVVTSVGVIGLLLAILAFLMADAYLPISFPNAAYLPWQTAAPYVPTAFDIDLPGRVRVEVAFGGIFRAAVVAGAGPIVLGLGGLTLLRVARRHRRAERLLERLPLFGAIVAESNWLAWADVKDLLIVRGVSPQVAAETAAGAIFGRSRSTAPFPELEIEAWSGKLWLPIGVAAREAVRPVGNGPRSPFERTAWQVDVHRRLVVRNAIVTTLATIFAIQTGLSILQPVYGAGTAMTSDLTWRASLTGNGNRGVNVGLSPRTAWWVHAGTIGALGGLALLTALGPRRYVERTPVDPQRPSETPLYDGTYSRRQLRMIAWGLLWWAFIVRWNPAGLSAVLMLLSLVPLAMLRRQLNRIETMSIQQRIAIGLDAGARPARAVLWGIAGYDGWREHTVGKYLRRLLLGDEWHRPLPRLRIADRQFGVPSLRLGLGRALSLGAVEAALGPGVERRRERERSLLRSWGFTVLVLAISQIVLFQAIFVLPTMKMMLQEFGVSYALESPLASADELSTISPVIRLHRAATDRKILRSALLMPLMFLGWSMTLFLGFSIWRIARDGRSNFSRRSVLIRWLALLRSDGLSWAEAVSIVESVDDRKKHVEVRLLKRADRPIAFDASERPLIESPEAWVEARLLTAGEVDRAAIERVDPSVLRQIVELREVGRHRRELNLDRAYRMLLVLLILPPVVLSAMNTYLPLIVLIEWSGDMLR